MKKGSNETLRQVSFTKEDYLGLEKAAEQLGIEGGAQGYVYQALKQQLARDNIFPRQTWRERFGRRLLTVPTWIGRHLRQMLTR